MPSQKPTLILSFLFCLISYLASNAQTINPEKIDIVRDKWGVPHIYAATNPEVAYGLAWAQAEDNFTTIQQTLMFAKGLLGKKYGPGGAAGDFFAKLIQVEELVEERIDKDISPEFMKYLEGFCEGINAYAVAHPKKVLTKDLFPVTPKDVLVSYPAKISEFMGLGRTVSLILNGTYYDRIAGEMDFSMRGSNSFAFRKAKTEDGFTYLISNPHVQISGPEAFYEVHVVSEEGLNFHGAMFPGSVSPQVGTNQHLGWTHTNNYYDNTDVFLLKMHPTEKNKYEYNGEWLELEERDIKLKAKVKPIPFPLGAKRKVYYSKYGPTLKSKDGNFFAIRMATYMSIRAPEQWYKMNLATDLESFKKALEMDGLPYFNITYADKDDNIMYLFNGHFPQRNPGFNWSKVVPGNSSEALWTEFVPLEKRPKIFNPSCGYVYNVNHNPFKCTCQNEWLDRIKYDTLVGYDKYDDNNRSYRFREIYQDGDKVSMESLKEIKYDVGIAQKTDLGKMAKQIIQMSQNSNNELLTPFKNWDLQFDLEEVAPTIFHLMVIYLQRNPADFGKSSEAVPEAGLYKAFAFAKSHLEEHFGKIQVPYKEFARFKRGNKDLPIYGGLGALAARWGSLSKDNGRYYAGGGDNFMMFIKYGPNGVENFESIVPFGSSSNPESPHYNNQMELYTEKGAKKLTFDKKLIYENAEKVYHPMAGVK